MYTLISLEIFCHMMTSVSGDFMGSFPALIPIQGKRSDIQSPALRGYAHQFVFHSFCNCPVSVILWFSKVKSFSIV